MEPKAMSKRVIAVALAAAALAGCSTQEPGSASPQPISTERTPEPMSTQETPSDWAPTEFDLDRTMRVLADAYGGDDEELALARAEAFTRYMGLLGIAGAVTAYRENIEGRPETHFNLHFVTEDGRNLIIDVTPDHYGIWDQDVRQRLLIFDWEGDRGEGPPVPNPNWP